MKRTFLKSAFVLALGTSWAAAIAAGAVEAAPTRSPTMLAADLAWLHALATRMSDAASRLTDLNTAADTKDATSAATQKASAANAAASAPAKGVSVKAGKAVAPAGPSVASRAGAGAIEPAPSAASAARSPAQFSWERAHFGELRGLSIQETATGLPAVAVEQAFGKVRVEVTSGWLSATQALAEAQVLVGDSSNPCYVHYRNELAKVFSTDMKVERVVDSEPALRRAVPAFAAFAELTPACKPLLRHTWPQSRPGTRSTIEAGLVWWIGRLMTCRTSAWEVPPALALPAAPIDRPKELLAAMDLDPADAQPVIDLYRAAFHGGCPPR